jgi:hypothetical protein
MNPRENELEGILKKTTDQIQRKGLTPAELQESRQKVWSQLSGESHNTAIFRNCQDFEALIPDYLDWKQNSALPSGASDIPASSQFLLMEDHLQECVACRKKYAHAQKGEEIIPLTGRAEKNLVKFPPLSSFWKPVLALAATFFLVAGIWQWPLINQYFRLDSTHLATIRNVEGGLFDVKGESVTPIAVASAISSGQLLRTAKDSRAQVELADGSVVEMAPRSELSVMKKWDGLDIELVRGQILVQAAKQHGHLYVDAEDCKVSVVGTVFAVNHGLKGSRVSVLEGKVRVQNGSQDQFLTPGGQLSTDASLGRTPIAEEVAWSRNAVQYLAFLEELKAVREQAEQAGLLPGLRYHSALLEMAPPNTSAYIAIPNFSRALNFSYQLLEQRVQENEVLKGWWNEKFKSAEETAQLKEALNKIQTYGEFLGDEIVICVGSQPLLLAEVKRPEDLRSHLRQDIPSWTEKAKNGGGVQLVEDLQTLSQLPASSREKELVIFLPGPFLAVSPHPQTLIETAGYMARQQTNPFVSGSFYARLQQSYKEGADWLIAIDLEKPMMAATNPTGQAPSVEAKQHLQVAGLDNMKHLILEHKEFQGHTDNRAALTFKGPRHGLAAWLAAPAPMGTLSYVSPNANFVTGFVVKNPAQLLDEILSQTQSLHQGGKGLDEIQQETGLNVRDDLVAPLGGEVALAMDGPMLPTPSWKVILEVNDPARLQQSLQTLFNLINQKATSKGEPGIQWQPQNINGKPGFILTRPQSADIFLQFHEGYLIIAPSQALIAQAIQFRESGNTLTQSAAFKALLPRDGHQDFSGMVYQNLGPIVKPLAEWAGNLSDKANPLIESLTKDTKPGIIYLYGEEERILMGSTSPLTSLGLNLGSLLKMQNQGRNFMKF